MRTTPLKSIDLAAATRRVAEQPAAAITLAELVRAFGIARCDGSDTRLRKWVDAYGSCATGTSSGVVA